ncbi:MAG: hypothetical protein E7673_03335 [Ruminococcaceae bacterium]|nr:hypothetical protein [Oscillospiraceae bacterium]
MKIDKTKLDAMLTLSDEALWKEIRTVAAAKGINMPEKAPNPKELEKVRGALRDADKLNLPTAMRLINDLKRGEK